MVLELIYCQYEANALSIEILARSNQGILELKSNTSMIQLVSFS